MSLPEARTASTAAPAATTNLLEVFVDGKPVMVEPGTTVLQVAYTLTPNKDVQKSDVV